MDSLCVSCRTRSAFLWKYSILELAREPHQQAHFVMTPQVHDQFITVKHDGPMRDSGKRGWIVKLLDWLGPF